ncbi:DNA-binding response OmpR family regulator [Arcanobacterium wilhelmae]|uniref:DNA-binding response OmpR family regulator n=1 Tax=Arcanobacterium wilhelmae TaxID=1803177 RepID=A0ABT9N9T6_9ACTO|nr:response regulator transcription factor [Arcanobacterium wilhelmae]MDP9800283.1 DNA-binding response OmpR family regulator [Arcanobacterium wilhelmae]WFN89720.1 response regulator transcription factor [Arcanobacterium wilhelmae]
MTSRKVLIVDDEPQIRSILGYIVETTGREWVEAPSAEAAEELLSSQEFALIMLDVMLPGTSGVEWCRQVRARSQIPIILLSALSEEDDRIRGLEAGADDYVTKPFSPREVALRIEVLLKRTNPTNPFISLGRLKLDPASGKVTTPTSSITLPATEARVLETLLANIDATVSSATLLAAVWQTTETVGGREMVRITIHRLRAHLKQAGLGADIIETVRGIGYRVRNINL